MVKGQFSTLDLAAAIGELQVLQGMRVANIYDVDSKTYLLKLAKGEQKAMLLVESGIRIHTTDYAWPKSNMPSGFSMKMRKHIRTRRIESIKQLGVDRVLDIEFGQGELCTHLIIELYARGNIILTDGEYRILSLLRSRTHVVAGPGQGEGKEGKKDEDNSDVRVAVGEVYPFQLTKADLGTITEDALRTVLSQAAAGDNFKKALAAFHGELGPALIEHCVRLAGIDPYAKVSAVDLAPGSEALTNLHASLASANGIIANASSAQCKGYIIQKREKKAIAKGGEDDTMLVYDGFHPLLMKQFESQPYLVFDTFLLAVDEFFSKMESQKMDVRAVQQQKAALKKLEYFQKDHEKRLQGLQQEQDRGEQHAFLLEANTQLVDGAIGAVNSLLATGMDWDQVKAMVDEAKSMSDPVATHIAHLRLEKNAIVLNLRDPYAYDDEDDSDDEAGLPKQSRPEQVEVDLGLNAHGNARKYHDRKKHARTKEQKTRDVSKQALKSVEKATHQKIKEVEIRAQITKARKTYWFEKFLWFISSDNFLVIAGRDAQQNEMLYKRYFRKGDIYVHADIHGAATCIIKNSNPDPETLPPPRTLSEAGVWAICNSAAWDAKIVISAYWVHHHQVSKTAPTGEYLTTGSFMIRGKKNFLPPAPLVLGYGVLFRVEDSCIANHLHERRALYGESDDIIASAREYEERSHQIQLRQRPARLGSTPSEEGKPGQDGEEALVDTLAGADSGHESGGSEPENEDGQAAEELGDGSSSSGSSDDEDGGTQFPETHIAGGYLGSLMGASAATDSSDGEQDPDEDAAGKASETSRRAYISAKQRREMKKKAKTGAGDRDSLDDNDSPPPDHKPQKPEPASKPKGQAPSAPVPRGKKGKLKKIKEKYADQDEEERQLRMDILKSAGAPAPPKKAAKSGGRNKKAGGKPQSGPGAKGLGATPPAPVQAVTQQEGSEPPSAAKDPALVEADRDVVMAARQTRKADKAREEEEVKQLMAEENILDDDEKDSLTVVDSLTGVPRGDDLLMFAMAYCAPYTAMTSFKYKVKLQPGTQRKGKASKQAVDLFSRAADVPLEKDLMRAIPDPELIQQMPSKVKLSAPNLHGHQKKK